MFTAKYVVMCRALPELQVGHEWKEGDWFCGDDGTVKCIGSDILGVVEMLKERDHVFVPLLRPLTVAHAMDQDSQPEFPCAQTWMVRRYRYYEPVWLPRLDQLITNRGMRALELVGLTMWMKYHEGWDYGFTEAPLGATPSAEELALAYVQDQVGRTWNGKSWRTGKEK